MAGMQRAKLLLALAAAYSPQRELFSGVEQGLVLDPSDLSSLFQDAGSTPVTGAGQTVALARDKSGRGNHVTLANCTLGRDESGYHYLNFGGVNTSGVTPNIDFSGTDKMTVIVGVHKASDAARAALVELGATPTATPGSFATEAPSSSLNGFGATAGGTTLVGTGGFVQAAPTSIVLTMTDDIAGPSLVLRRNGVQLINATSSQGTGNFTNVAPIYLGRRGGLTIPLNGRIYGLIVRGAATNALALERAERYMGRKMGVFL